MRQCEEKMRLLADHLEARNRQIDELTQMYTLLQEQYDKAQDAADCAANLLSERDGIIEEYLHLIITLKENRLAESKRNAEEAALLKDQLTMEGLQFRETLNRLSQGKIPAEEPLQRFEALLREKAQAYADLEARFEALAQRYEEGNAKAGQLAADLEQLLREKANLQQENQDLRRQLHEAKMGRKELREIEMLKRTISEQTTKQHRLLKRIRELEEKLRQQQALADHEAQGENQDDIIREREDTIIALKRRNDELVSKHQKQLEELGNECRRLRQRLHKADGDVTRLQLENDLLSDQKKELAEQKRDDALERLKEMQSHAESKIQRLKKRIEAEIRQKIDAQELLVSQKEEILNLKKDHALLKDQFAQLKYTDIEPLVTLLKDLRLESIEMEDEYRQMIGLIPPAKPVIAPELPKGICESIAAFISHILAQTSLIAIENEELRVLLQRFARTASTYHRIVQVIQQYPILSTDDIGNQEPYGNWVLGVDVEHLQRTVVKLHEILSKKRIA